MEVIRERKRLREQAIRKASSWAKGLAFKCSVILVGSYARGDFNLWSDVDILLVSKDFKKGPVDRLKALDIPSGFQVIPITPKELKRLLAKKDQLAIEAFSSGIVLRDDLRLF
jgi:hypothetical protein